MTDAQHAAQLAEALNRAKDHLIMSGTKCVDAPEALDLARAALAAWDRRNAPTPKQQALL